jgi:hypothetical protein
LHHQGSVVPLLWVWDEVFAESRLMGIVEVWDILMFQSKFNLLHFSLFSISLYCCCLLVVGRMDSLNLPDLGRKKNLPTLYCFLPPDCAVSVTHSAIMKWWWTILSPACWLVAYHSHSIGGKSTCCWTRQKWITSINSGSRDPWWSRTQQQQQHVCEHASPACHLHIQQTINRRASAKARLTI